MQQDLDIYTGDVFIAGGMPEITYVSRDDLGIDLQLTRWSKKRNKPLLSVSGPTKSGKTVLLKKHLSNASWLSGGAIDGAGDFWETVCAEFDIYTDSNMNVSTGSSLGTQISGGIDIISAGGSAGRERNRSLGRSLNSSHRSAARKWIQESLKSNNQIIIVIDDFHYIPSEEQLQIIQGLKDLIFMGLGVVVLSVPHRAFDVERAETEMTGRVERIQMNLWSHENLSQIAIQGFNALNIEIDYGLIDRLIKESFGSPHLMQNHCFNSCIQNNIEEKCESTTRLRISEWDSFFQNSSISTSMSAYELLKNGPRVRSDRKERILTSGISTDIYGAILSAIEFTGPNLSLTYEEIRTALREVLQSDPPQRHEVTNVLEQMTSIAKNNIEGEPVLEYDQQYNTLHIVDPFFAYFLRWGEKNL